MQVVLLERIEKLGQMGDVVRVKNGFARNFLLPQNKALRATDANLKRFDQQRAELEARNLERRGEAADVASRMEDVSCILVRQASDMGQLYGSVNSRDIAESLSAAGYKVERGQVVLDRPIKTLGLHDVRIALHPEVTITVTANVARSEDEAALQAQGIDVLAETDDDDDGEQDSTTAETAPIDGGVPTDDENLPAENLPSDA
ncbi:MAG: 50S ribosomal protein L9 [Alphaproteobacteria bacterium]